MSTKTSIKRTALVAVAALGFGMVSTVSANADFGTGALSLQTVTLDNPTTSMAGRVGQEVSITVRGDISAGAAASAEISQALSVAATISSQPSGSALYPKLTGTGSDAFGGTSKLANTTCGLVYADADSQAACDGGNTYASTGSATTVATLNWSTETNETTTAQDNATLATLTFTPAVAGVYTVIVWNEKDRGLGSVTTGSTPDTYTATSQAALSGSESFQTFTVNVTSTSASTVALTGFGTTSVAAGSSGALIKVSLKDAAGNIAIPATGETVTLTPSGTGRISKVNDVDVTGSSTAGAAYNLAASAFGQTGTAWVNVTNATAETISLTATISGSSSAAISLTYRTVTADTGSDSPTPYSSTATGYESYTAGATLTAYVPLGTSTTTFRSAGTYSADAATYHEFRIVDTNGGITGALPASGAYDWDAAATLGSTGYATYSVTTTTTVAGTAYTVTDADGATTVNPRAIQGGAITPTVNTINSTSGSTTTITGVLKDTFGRALGSTAVTASVAGRNPTTVAQTAITDALGNFSFTIADANTTSLLTADTVTLASTAYTTTSKSVTILYGTANAASKVVLTSDDYTAGVANDSVSAQPIVAATSTTGKAGAEAGAKSVSAKVTNAAGAILAGVPVTFTVSGTGAAILSTKKLVYTDLTGVATTSVYAWKSGTYTVTATAGAVSGTATETFSQSTAAAARIISATANGSVVTAKAEDRFGNPVANVRIYAKIASGSGYFGTGVTTTYADTTVDGTASFVVSGGAATVTVSNISFSSPAGTIVGQTSAAKGYDIGGADAVAFVATVAGTSTVAETGVGNEYAAAGVSSATVDATVSGSSDAIDAANEATDAANAATDAANAAAEAADAATAAAQDAQAAVAELATKVASLIAGIKAQITTLTNLVIKIQKKVRA